MAIVYEKIISEIEALLQLYMTNQRMFSNSTQPANLHGVLEVMTTLRRSRDIATATNIINKVLTSIHHILWFFDVIYH